MRYLNTASVFILLTLVVLVSCTRSPGHRLAGKPVPVANLSTKNHQKVAGLFDVKHILNTIKTHPSVKKSPVLKGIVEEAEGHVNRRAERKARRRAEEANSNDEEVTSDEGSGEDEAVDEGGNGDEEAISDEDDTRQ